MARRKAALLQPGKPDPARASLQMAGCFAMTPGPRPTAANAEISARKETALIERTKSASKVIGKN